MKVYIIYKYFKYLLLYFLLGILGDNEAFVRLTENTEKVNEELKEKLEEKEKIKKDFEEVKEKRKSGFMNFFNLVA